MPPYSTTSPLKEIAIRQLVGSACFVGSAITSGLEWNTTELEKIFENRMAGKYTGRYRKMLQGIVPSNSICKLIQKGKNGELTKWRNHPYWMLLTNTFSDIDYLNLYQNSMYLNWASVYPQMFLCTNREFLSNDTYRYWEDTNYNEFSGHELSSEDLRFDLFARYTAWAREAREANYLQPMYQCGKITRLQFPKIVCNSPYLFIRWPLLAELYRNLIWTCPHFLRNTPWFDMQWKELVNEINIEEKIARDNGINLPPKNLFRRINKNHLTKMH
jgi:hypothetical protein